MKDEVLQKALTSDGQVIPRYDVVLPNGTKVAENAELVLKNTVLTEGTPLNKKNLLSDDTARAFGLDPQAATPDDVLRAIRGSVGYCPRIRVFFSAGGMVYVRNNTTNDVVTYEVPSEGYVVADVLDFGSYSVWGVYQSVTSAEETILVDSLKLYEKSIDYYTCIWKFTVNDEVGATITVKHTDGLTLTGIVGADKTCSISLPKPGKYTATGIYDGCTSDTYTLTANSDHTGTTQVVNMQWITVTVNITAGSVVAITSGSVTKGGTSLNGSLKVWLPNKATWLVSCTLGDKAATSELKVDTYMGYVVNLKYYGVYGVRIPLSSSSPASPEYTDNAVGMTPGYSGWATNAIIDSIKPCVLKDGVVQYYLDKSDLTKKVDGSAATLTSTTAGDVMVEIPKIGYRMYSDGTYQYIKITDKPDHPDYCYLAHSLDGVGDCDKIYIAAYLAINSSSKLYSVSGATISNNISLTNARTYAQAKGTGYQLLSFYPWTLIQCLYTIMYKNLNSVQMIGYGYTGQSSAAPTGGTNAKGPCAATGTAGTQISFLNIEDPWGNMQCHLDGISTDSNGKICTAYNNFNNTGSGYPYSKDFVTAYSQVQGYIKTVQGPSEWGFIINDANGSSSTYYCDYSEIKAGCNAIIGKPYNNKGDDGQAGMYYLRIMSNDMSTNYVAARIVYKHKA